MLRHQVAVIGAGSAGLTVARSLASLGVDVALCDPRPPGGECTWTGCVPSKALLELGRAAYRLRRGAPGITGTGVTVDFDAVREEVDRIRREVAAGEDPSVLADEGVTFYPARARFEDAQRLGLSDGRTLEAGRIVIATGAEPRVPAGLAEVPHHTTDTIWELDRLPDTLVVVGGGPAGVELAQAFRRLGAEVILLAGSERILPAADPDAAALVAAALEREGVEIRTSARVVEGRGREGDVEVSTEAGESIRGSHLLVAAGKRIDVTGLRPERAGLATDPDGRLVLDRSLRTSLPHVFACGDVAGARHTHSGGTQGAGVAVNLLFPIPLPAGRGTPRWAVFSDPEVAQVGLTLDEARALRRRTTATRVPMEAFDRAVTRGETEGFLQAVHSPWGKLAGVTIVGPEAAELANQWVGHVARRRRLLTVATDESIYPTMGSTTPIVAYHHLLDLLARPLAGRLVPLLMRTWMRRR